MRGLALLGIGYLLCSAYQEGRLDDVLVQAKTVLASHLASRAGAEAPADLEEGWQRIGMENSAATTPVETAPVTYHWQDSYPAPEARRPQESSWARVQPAAGYDPQAQAFISAQLDRLSADLRNGKDPQAVSAHARQLAAYARAQEALAGY